MSRNFSEETLTKETKHDFAGLIWSTYKQNRYQDVPGTLNVTNKLPKTKHSLNINMSQWVLRSRVDICKEARIINFSEKTIEAWFINLQTCAFVFLAASNKRGIADKQKK